MTIRKSILLVVIAAASIAIPVAAQADPGKQTWREIEKQWPEEVPTPWFCYWVGPHGVCVPPF